MLQRSAVTVTICYSDSISILETLLPIVTVVQTVTTNYKYFSPLTEEEVDGGVRRHVDHGGRGLALVGGVHPGELGHEAEDAR